ncbi:MAG TPA: AmmeMemoRadiSam system protein B [Phycisphaerales bacterium]|nr:AmmeMemoRadiSam system protein B [Phycisphaerales bacterium]HMP37601.1 AmmeMemoRadiSam system protein B [Phycisphaerales bacterium]
MSTNTLPEHIRRPHVRQFQPLPAVHQGQQLVVLRDPMMLLPQSMAVSPQAVPVIAQFQGERTVEEIAAAMGAPNTAPFIELAQRLDQMGLLWGPTFEDLERQLKAKIAEFGAFPNQMAEDPATASAQARAQLDQWLAEADDAELDRPVGGLVVPHLDYARGWPNYAAAYRCIDATAGFDRVVILGTNHFGIGDGVVLTEWAFDTVFGRTPNDPALVERLRTKFGDPGFVDQLDHHAEHSIKLQLPWIQHRLGDIPVVAALVPDPTSPMLADDGKRLALEPFIAGFAEALDDLGGRTLFVSSADMSHVGPQFGEPRAVDAQRKVDVERHDRDLMARYLSGDPESFLAHVRETRNPTRWCSVGNMYAALRLSKAAGVELIDYRQACDDKGVCLVSSAAMALVQ